MFGLWDHSLKNWFGPQKRFHWFTWSLSLPAATRPNSNSFTATKRSKILWMKLEIWMNVCSICEWVLLVFTPRNTPIPLRNAAVGSYQWSSGCSLDAFLGKRWRKWSQMSMKKECFTFLKVFRIERERKKKWECFDWKQFHFHFSWCKFL